MTKGQARTLKHQFLLEIGTEEIPANYLSYADDPEHDLFVKAFHEAFSTLNRSGSLQMGDLKVYLTPRRIVLLAKNILFNTAPVKEPVFGPPQAQSYDDQGRPSDVLRGFMRSKGVSLSDLEEFDYRGKRCVGFWKSEAPKPFKEVLRDFVLLFINRLSFPKMMRWDDSDLRFPRPIRNILCILDDRAVKFPVGNLVSDNRTLLFRNGIRTSIQVKGIRDYFRVIQKSGVLLDQRSREQAIEKQVQKLTEKLGGVYARNELLLKEVTFLAERPVCLSGRFDEQYTNLPKELLSASLSKKQRFFSVLNASGKHLPYFIGVLDGSVRNKVLVAETMGAILKATLQDSLFFFEEDAKIYRRSGAASGVEKLQADLKHLVYIKDMGTMFDKVNRMRELSLSLGREWGLSPSEVQDLERAARYSKTDLLTQMVGEFPELQGIMGGYYMRCSGKNDAICKAISEQYMPVSADGALPESKMGAALALLDKADLIVACFVIGKIPTSSQDPYALKRALAGILRITIEYQLNVSWERLVTAILDHVQKSKIAKKLDIEGVRSKLAAFFRERAAYFFTKTAGFKEELVEAVLATDCDWICGSKEKLDALTKLEDEEVFKKTAKVVQRTSNILKSLNGAKIGAVKPQILREDLERQLFERYESQKSAIEKAIHEKEYILATSLYADAFFDILHVFFEKVLVNVPEPDLRRNRLSLLAAVRALYTDHVADLSKVRAVPENS